MARRGAVVVIDGDRVALIERRSPRSEGIYYLFPGGHLEEGESSADAAQREAVEELGLIVRIERLLAIGAHHGNEQHYYLASVAGGTFGTGAGEELRPDPTHPNGTYTPVWLGREELMRCDIRPKSLATLLHGRGEMDSTTIIRITD